MKVLVFFSTIVALVAGAPGATTALAATGSPVNDTVALHFAWPTDVDATVIYVATKKKTVGEQVQETAINGRYHMSTARTHDGVRISAGEVELSVASDERLPGLQERLRNLLIKATSAPPAYVVNHGGEYVRLDGLDQFYANLRAGMSDFMADLPDEAQDQVNQILDAALTKEQLEAEIVADWNRIVGSWIGAELDRGDLYEASYVDRIPVLGNMPVQMKAQFRFVDRVACSPRDKGEDCVDLEMRTFIDPESLAEAVNRFMRQVGPEGGQPAIEDIQSTSVARLVTEPDTLLPHRLRVTNITASAVGRDTSGGAPQNARQVQELDIIYSYN